MQTNVGSSSVSTTTRTLIQKYGILSVYSGSGTLIYTVVPYSALVFGVYGSTKRFIVGDDEKIVPTVLQMVMTGMLTGMLTTPLVTPVECIKSKIQVLNPDFSTIKMTNLVLKEAGLRGLYRGFLATLIRNVFGDSAFFGSYELSKPPLRQQFGYHLGTLIAGGFAGIAYWTSIYPIDLVKNRLQTDKLKYEDMKYKGIIDGIQKIYTEEGYVAFWKGFKITLLRAFFVNAVGLYAYEKAKNTCKLLLYVITLSYSFISM